MALEAYYSLLAMMKVSKYFAIEYRNTQRDVLTNFYMRAKCAFYLTRYILFIIQSNGYRFCFCVW